jgi:hypothetical protein
MRRTLAAPAEAPKSVHVHPCRAASLADIPRADRVRDRAEAIVDVLSTAVSKDRRISASTSARSSLTLS